jgi:hypothetical protein
MKISTAAYLRKYQALLNAAKNKGSAAQIRWRSMNLGSWSDLNPRWNLAGGKILFHFFHDKNFSFQISSIRPNPSGISILLSSAKNPIPESFDVQWLDSEFERSRNSGRLWELVRHWLKLNFPACEIIWAGKRSDLTRSISGRFFRAIFQNRGRHSLLIAVDPDAGPEAHLALSQALLWLSCPAIENRIKAPAAIHFLVPSGGSSILNHRCQYLNRKRVDAKVWEYQEGEGFQFDRAASSSFGMEDRDFRWPLTGPFRWSSQLEQVLQMAPDLIRRYPRFYDYDSLRLWGLEFAQATGSDRDRICFGVGTPRVELNEDNYDCLRSLVNEILFFRRPDSPDTQHPYYRLQAERWLESLILENIPELFPEMAPESVYSQIPVYVGKDPGRVDILGVDRRGTLTVMELKVSEDADMPVQALDYWGRVIRHNANGDFKRRGYFSEINLTRQRPKIYLVSPIFSFHSSTESLIRYLDPELEVWKIAVNEDWRCGIKILRRVRYCCGDLE